MFYVRVLLAFPVFSNDYVLVTIEKDDVHIHKQNHTHNRYPSTYRTGHAKCTSKLQANGPIELYIEREVNDVKCSLIVGWILENPVELNEREGISLNLLNVVV